MPSLVTITECPVSAISMFAPVIPTSASKYFARSTPRASESRSAYSLRLRSGARCVCALRNAASTSGTVTCTAGAMMWLGDLAAQLDDVLAEVGLDRGDAVLASQSLIPHSSEIIVLPLLTVLAPAFRQISSTIARASSAVSAQCTTPPLATTCAS